MQIKKYVQTHERGTRHDRSVRCYSFRYSALFLEQVDEKEG